MAAGFSLGLAEFLVRAERFDWPDRRSSSSVLSVRYRKYFLDPRIELTITEVLGPPSGRMTAAVGYPTLRLVRWRIGGWEIGDLVVGGVAGG